MYFLGYLIVMIDGVGRSILRLCSFVKSDLSVIGHGQGFFKEVFEGGKINRKARSRPHKCIRPRACSSMLQN